MLFIFILSDLDGDTKSILSKFIDYGECLIPYMRASIQGHLGKLVLCKNELCKQKPDEVHQKEVQNSASRMSIPMC